MLLGNMYLFLSSYYSSNYILPGFITASANTRNVCTVCDTISSGIHLNSLIES